MHALSRQLSTSELVQLAREHPGVAGPGILVVFGGNPYRLVGACEGGGVHVDLHPSVGTDREATRADAFLALDQPQLVVPVSLAGG